MSIYPDWLETTEIPVDSKGSFAGVSSISSFTSSPRETTFSTAPDAGELKAQPVAINFSSTAKTTQFRSTT